MANHGMNTELKVGIFTVIGLAAIAGTAITLDGNPFTKKNLAYYTVLDNVGGIGPRTQVRTSGVQIGEVLSLDILPNGAKVNFQVRSNVVIPEGSILEIRSRGVLGDVFLEIVRSEENKKQLKENSLIPKVKEFSDMGSLMASVGSIAKDLKTVSTTLANVIGNAEGQSSLQNILHNVERISTDVRDLVAGERGNIARMVAAIRVTAERLATIVEDNTGDINQTISNVVDTTGDLKLLVAELRSIASGENRKKLDSIINYADSTLISASKLANRLNIIADKIDRGEGTLGQIVAKDDTANEIKTTLRGVQEFIKPAQRMKIEIDYKGEVRTKKSSTSGIISNNFNVMLATGPDRYYLLGITDSPSSQKYTTTRTTTSTENGSTINKEETYIPEDRSKLRINFQFAKKFNLLGVRFGLFQSYAGIAGDAYMFDNKLTASLEAFNFGTEDSFNGNTDNAGIVQLKTYLNYFMTPNLYFTGGVDNIGKKPSAIPFMGAGLRFTDDDLKSIITAATLAK